MFFQLKLNCHFIWFETESLILRCLHYITTIFNHLFLQLSHELLRYKIYGYLGIKCLSVFRMEPISFTLNICLNWKGEEYNTFLIFLLSVWMEWKMYLVLQD